MDADAGSAVDAAAIAAAYRRIDESGKERFDPGDFRRLYWHFFGRSIGEDDLDVQLVAYAAHERAHTLREFMLHLEYLDTEPTRRTRPPKRPRR